VPLEVGVPGASDWREETATLAVFCERYLAPSAARDGGAASGGHDDSAGTPQQPLCAVPERAGAGRTHAGDTGRCAVAYLAQHRLFDQLPALLADVRHPRCWPGPWEVLNVWLGTAGTVRARAWAVQRSRCAPLATVDVLGGAT